MKQLKLNNNRIKKLDGDTFSAITKLTRLYLSGNLITHLPRSLFSRTPDLEELWLSNNMILSWHPSLLHTLSKLRSVTLKRNNLTQIHLGSFTKSTPLAKLNLAHNKIKNISFSPFPSDIFLYLYGNNIPCSCQFLNMLSLLNTVAVVADCYISNDIEDNSSLIEVELGKVFNASDSNYWSDWLSWDTCDHGCTGVASIRIGRCLSCFVANDDYCANYSPLSRRCYWFNSKRRSEVEVGAECRASMCTRFFSKKESMYLNTWYGNISETNNSPNCSHIITDDHNQHENSLDLKEASVSSLWLLALMIIPVGILSICVVFLCRIASDRNSPDVQKPHHNDASQENAGSLESSFKCHELSCQEENNTKIQHIE